VKNKLSLNPNVSRDMCICIRDELQRYVSETIASEREMDVTDMDPWNGDEHTLNFMTRGLVTLRVPAANARGAMNFSYFRYETWQLSITTSASTNVRSFYPTCSIAPIHSRSNENYKIKKYRAVQCNPSTLRQVGSVGSKIYFTCIAWPCDDLTN